MPEVFSLRLLHGGNTAHTSPALLGDRRHRTGCGLIAESGSREDERLRDFAIHRSIKVSRLEQRLEGDSLLGEPLGRTLLTIDDGDDP